MKLQPFIDDPIKDAVGEILDAAGVTKKKSAKLELDEIRKHFDENQASIEDVAKMVGAVMRTSDKEEIRIRAGELALKVHGIFKDIDEKMVPQITININGDGNNTMVNLLCPS